GGVGSARQAQVEVGDAEGEVESGLPGHRQRLQGDVAVETADQHVAAEPDGHGGFAGGAYIVAGDGAAPAGGIHEHAPDHAAARGRADIEAEFGDAANIEF